MMGLIENGGDETEKGNEWADGFDFQNTGALGKIFSVMGPRPPHGRIRFLAPLGIHFPHFRMSGVIGGGRGVRAFMGDEPTPLGEGLLFLVRGPGNRPVLAVG
jgi:hypothetical protein